MLKTVEFLAESFLFGGMEAMDDLRLTEALKKYFSHERFRKPQGEIVASIVSGKDTLAIMPTGGGKSLCYQLPAMLLDGVTIVISPLIALMKDQVDALRARGIPADMINSSQSWARQSEALEALAAGRLKLAYIAPERFRARSFARALSGVKISLFAVDEAHCISQWGHDFRPDYMRLGEVLESLGRPVCAAFTATATPEVREDISKQLMLRDPAVYVSGFARPNLSFNVREVSSKAEKVSRICELAAGGGAGIVYCATRKSAEFLSEQLAGRGIAHTLYHGAMSPQEREKSQEDFISGRKNIAVATNAFGMGIDRPDIRFVCHYELPGSVEALYQESGRAGRDGQESRCEMLMMYSDKRVQEFFIEGSNPSPDFIRSVYRAIKNNADESASCLLDIETIADIIAGKFSRRTGAKRPMRAGGANPMAVSSAISILRKRGLVERFDVAGSRVRGTRLPDPDIEPEDIVFPPGMLEEKRRRDEAKLRDVIAYAYAKDCRQRWILNYFGEKGAECCGKCDNCAAATGTSDAPTRELSPMELTVVRKALSGVARLSRRAGPRTWLPRFGRGMIVKSLLGSSDARIRQLGLDKISTHAILKVFGKKFVNSLFDALADAGLVETALDGEYPLLGITDAGVDVLLDSKTTVRMHYPRVSPSPAPDKRKKRAEDPAFEGGKAPEKPRGKKAAEELDSSDGRLYEIMAKERMRLAAARKVKPYQIFSNATLAEFARLRPRTLEEAARIKGVGEVKLRSTAPAFVRIIEEYGG